MKHALPLMGILAAALAANAQTGTSAGFAKISETNGNLNTTLINQGMFGFVSETSTPSKIISAAPFEGNGAIYFIDLALDGSAESTSTVKAADFSYFDAISDAGFGTAVLDMGDLNGDQKNDFMIGAPGISATGALFTLLSDGASFTLSEVSIPTEMAGASALGSFLAHDGDQILIASSAGSGAIYECSFDLSIGISLTATIDDTNGTLAAKLDDGDQFGTGLSVADMNGDGHTDIICGAPGDDDQGSNFGAVYLLYRNENGEVEGVQKLSRLEGDFGGFMNIDDEFGISVRAIGDLDEDGTIDLAVGAPGDDDGGIDIGAVWILFMRPDGTVKNEKKINRLEGNFGGDLNYDDRFGTRIATIGDHNNDGTVDLVVGTARDDDGGTNKGAVYTVFIERCPSPSGFYDFEVVGATVHFTAEGGAGYSHIWNFDDGGYSQAQNPSHTYESTGNYWVCLAINSECGGNNFCQNVQVSSTLGIEERLAEETAVYPNPARDRISVKSGTIIRGYALHDITGKVAQEGVTNQLKITIELAGLNPGLYFLALDIAGVKVVKKVQLM